MQDTNKGLFHNKKILLWNTYCADEFSEHQADRAYKTLPSSLHTFFEQDVQDLARELR